MHSAAYFSKAERWIRNEKVAYNFYLVRVSLYKGDTFFADYEFSVIFCMSKQQLAALGCHTKP